MNRLVAPLAAAILVCGWGCKRTGQEFPLAVGKSWSYMVGVWAKRAEEVRVLRRVSVGGVDGFELGGPMGESRIAWKGDTLIAEQLPNATFNPPIPLLVSGVSKARREWSGMIGSMGKGRRATAVLIQEPEDKKSRVLMNTLTIMAEGSKIEFVSWYRPGEGPIKQEQRNNEELVAKIEAIDQ